MTLGRTAAPAPRTGRRAGADHRFPSLELVPVFQPEIGPHDGNLFSFEALARWQHPDGHLVGPEPYLSAVAAAGRHHHLLERMLAASLEWQEIWCRSSGFRPPVAVNLCGSQLADPRTVPTIERIIDDSGSRPADVWVEVTEHAAMQLGADAALHALRDAGVRTAIDDFGTGWSSVQRLASFEWDAVKIDRTFVAELPAARHAAIASAIVSLAHELGAVVIAEGVETAAQADFLTSRGCDYLQGYLISRPIPGHDVTDRLDSTGRWTPSDR
jgi:EAL domain-containing protein (putative c-di-GMP-specific phosphodiesterase class I)